ncbi:MAG TPA: hypothetical protein PLB91_15950 [Spirochaetales bacterium]|nr:hypothetical protein [Spirochaetales bacterium]HRY55210.1 hypothetical protein [Spirochaetia bacterium]HRZ65289.1 hypothetical protein [Spirochaetia bacterium]
MAALEPPGNIRADLARYRRGIFSSLGEASARAFPEALPLAFAAGPATLTPARRRRASALLRGAWKGIEGGFRSGGLRAVGALLYLGLEGPVAELAGRIEGSLPLLGLEACPGPIGAREGLFLCGLPSEAAAARAAGGEPPSLAFGDCRLVLYRIDLGERGFEAVVWREAACAPRPGRARGLGGRARGGA